MVTQHEPQWLRRSLRSCAATFYAPLHRDQLELALPLSLLACPCSQEAPGTILENGNGFPRIGNAPARARLPPLGGEMANTRPMQDLSEIVPCVLRLAHALL